jgi:hypothetical protein
MGWGKETSAQARKEAREGERQRARASGRGASEPLCNEVGPALAPVADYQGYRTRPVITREWDSGGGGERGGGGRGRRERENELEQSGAIAWQQRARGLGGLDGS